MTNIHIHIKICCIIFFIIGIICYFLGCNPNYSNQCFNYNTIHGTSTGYVIDKNTCRKCMSVNTKGVCIVYYYYDCWDTNIKFNYGNNATCYYTIVSNTPNEDYANSKGVDYPINKNKKLLKINDSSQCINLKKGLDIWISGITFLSLSGLGLLYLIIEIVYNYIKNKKSNNNVIVV